MNHFLSVKRMTAVPVFILFLSAGFMGCQMFKEKPAADEVSIDKALTQQSLPSQPPAVKPAEPQEEFEQEPVGSQS